MIVQNLFDSSGNWIAFRTGNYVYSPDGEWIGWLPWNDDDVFDTHGRYLATVFYGNRLYHVLGKPYRGYPGYPGYAGYSAPPPGTRDVALSKSTR